jgi:predicted CXXCH cytochrome family protein
MNRTRTPSHGLLILLCTLFFLLPIAGQVEKTAHNLAGPSVGPDGRPVNPCYFCHTPHNGTANRALWNRSMPGRTYKLYESSTLKARLNQPTGSSRLCLSCHDGTIALDENPAQTRPKHAGPLRGKASLGTNLSDDHPVSFTYDSALAVAKGELVDPAVLASRTRLDETGQLQCTSCHDPHLDRNPKFLVMDNKFSQLCRNCHAMRGWASSVHATSTGKWKGAGLNPWIRSSFDTVAENACGNCHSAHSAGRPQALLNYDTESKNCFACHNGNGSSRDIEREFRKFSAHPVEQSESMHDAREDPRSMLRHVACGDCHNPHAAQAAATGRGSAGRAPQGVRGVSATGSRVVQASFEYEICYNCHGSSNEFKTTVIRRDPVTNVRLAFDAGNLSFHPVVSPGKNHDVAGLEAGYTPSSTITCTDCHNSDSTNGTRGPHGSAYEPILEREYDLQDPSPESFRSYSLCYKCHNRAVLLSDQSAFPHRLHVVNQQASCAVCHDAHGSRSSMSLINFMTRSRTGGTVVSFSSSGRLEYENRGRSQGRCYLRCHGSDHNPKEFSASRARQINSAK